MDANNEASRRYGKCESCGAYAVHSYRPKEEFVLVYPDKDDAQGHSDCILESTILHCQWFYICYSCKHINTVGFGEDSFADVEIFHELKDELTETKKELLQLAIDNDELRQKLNSKDIEPNDAHFGFFRNDCTIKKWMI